jgi:hypothetical protein
MARGDAQDVRLDDGSVGERAGDVDVQRIRLARWRPQTFAFAAIGAKYNPARNLLISGSVLFPLKSSGIRSRPVPIIGFEYSY